MRRLPFFARLVLVTVVRSICLSICGLALSACGTSGSGGPPAPDVRIQGSLAGAPIRDVDAVGYSYLFRDQEGAIAKAGVTLSSEADACSVVTNGGRANLTLLAIGVAVSSTTDPRPTIAPGTYAVQSVDAIVPVNAGAVQISTDATCSSIYPSGPRARSGTVTITTLTSTRIAGSFDLVFDTGDHVTGTFDVPICASYPYSLFSQSDAGCR